MLQGGIYVLQLMDTYVSSWSVFVMAATESILFGWVYGEWHTGGVQQGSEYDMKGTTVLVQ